jgi:hypothetical protein
MAAAVGSLRSLRTLTPESVAAALVACLWVSSKYAGTVKTIPSKTPPKDSSALDKSTLSISAEASTGLISPAEV